MYFFGFSVAQNYIKAMKWSRKTAEQGYAESINILRMLE